jgi:hypothetical protein
MMKILGGIFCLAGCESGSSSMIGSGSGSKLTGSASLDQSVRLETKDRQVTWAEKLCPSLVVLFFFYSIALYSNSY